VFVVSVVMFVAAAVVLPQTDSFKASVRQHEAADAVVAAAVPTPQTATTPPIKYWHAAVAPPPVPQAETTFIATVEKWRTIYATGANDMAKGAARPGRAKDLCRTMNGRSVESWTGTVETLSSNSDGLGILTVRIADHVVLTTWNNAVSDAIYHTLIDPGSAVFRKASSLSVGQKVTISGTFVPSDVDCVRESSLTMGGSLQSPDFIFKFFDIIAVD